MPVEAVIGDKGNTRRISIPGKKALIHQGSGQVLGVVSRDYRVVTNREAPYQSGSPRALRKWAEAQQRFHENTFLQ